MLEKNESRKNKAKMGFLSNDNVCSAITLFVYVPYIPYGM